MTLNFASHNHISNATEANRAPRVSKSYYHKNLFQIWLQPKLDSLQTGSFICHSLVHDFGAKFILLRNDANCTSDECGVFYLKSGMFLTI